MPIHSVPIFDERTSIRVARSLEARRNALGLTMDQVASKMGMSTSSVHNLMTGKHTYPTDVLERVANALDWTLLQLFFVASEPMIKDTPTMRAIGSILSKASAEAEARMLQTASGQDS